MTNQQRAEFLLNISHEGGFEEFLAQGIASSIASQPMNYHEATIYVSGIMSRVFDLTNNDEEKIWPELMPGGPGEQKQDEAWMYEIVWYDGETRVERDVRHSESPLNLVPLWNYPANQRISSMTITHQSSDEVTWWNLPMATAVVGLQSTIEALENIGIRDSDFDPVFQELYEQALDRGKKWKEGEGLG
jgi:hypothetical protein